MESGRLVSFFCTLAGLLAFASALSCNFPTRFWCDSEELATACGVYDQCRRSQWTLRENAEPVQFTLYYESLCPDCKQFITEMLFPTYQKVASITNLTLVPYGNAEETKDGNRWKFQCQHGPQECIGNIIATCTIALVKNIDVYFPFLNCMEASSSLPTKAAEECAKQFTAIPLSNILNCTTSDYGNEQEHQMALKTDALQPQHEYVPWVTLNGVHTETIQQEAEKDLLKLLCDTYTGQKPAACTS